MSQTGRRMERRLRLHELPLLIGLVLLWMMLWREISPMSFLSGVVLAIVLTRVFYLPPVELAGRFNVWYAVRYLGFFFAQLTIASFQVAWLAIKPGPPPKSSVIAVRLRTRSDFIITVTGITISLIPGSLVAEVDRFGSTLYLHVLNTSTQKQLTQMRRDVLHIERMLILAIGSRPEVEAIR